jgi:alkane 1-monooxygenase
VAALCWTLPVWLCIAADYFSPADSGSGKSAGHEWLLDARLYVLFALQLTNIVLMLKAASGLGWATSAEFAASAANIVALRVLVGTTSCCSGMALAHELLHRRRKHQRWMGRILLWTVAYDHFAVEHGRRHHRCASTADDPATARFDESLTVFVKRSLYGQWADAWQLENRRWRGADGNRLGRLLRHRVVQGLVVEMAILALVYAYFGLVALLMFLYQAQAAVRMLESVNYVQHWGLTRRKKRFRPADAWATDSWFTLHTFIGLARHADHHAHAGKSCHQLTDHAESPRLPYGYFVLALLVRWRNPTFRKLARTELAAKGLGPFAAQEG